MEGPTQPGSPGGSTPKGVPTHLLPLAAGDPRTFGSHRVIGRLGSGGMGQAYLAEALHGWVVVKVALPGPDVEQVRARMRREAEAMSLVDSPLVARLVSRDLGAERPWVAFQFIPGLTLAQRVQMFGPLPAAEQAGLGIDVARGLAAIHASGVVHRDLKPSNVVLTPDGARLIDFGAAEHGDATDLTTAGQLVGTLRWMAPEQFAPGSVGPATDIHAWGLLMLFAATGQAPVTADSTAATIQQVLHEPPMVPRDLLPADLADLIERAVAKDPARRPDAADLLSLLGRLPVAAARPDGGQSSAEAAPAGMPAQAGAHPDQGRGHAVGSPRPTPGRPRRGDGSSGSPGTEEASGRASRRRRVTWLAVGVGVAAALAAALVLVPGPSVGGADSRLPVQVAAETGSRLTRLSLGDTSGCVLDDADAVLCWGSNDHGQLGSPGGDSATPRRIAEPEGAASAPRYARVAVGTSHACALDTEGRAYCWGANGSGQLGTGDTTDRDVPVPVSQEGVLAGKRLVLIGAAAQHTCALDEQGMMFCWGSNADGQFGNGTTADSLRPVAVDTTGVLRGQRLDWFAVGERHTCARAVDGSAYCWGANDRGQLGNGSTRPALVPSSVLLPVGAPFRFARISAGGSTSCGWSDLGRVVCWGAGESGQRGDGTTGDATRPVPVDFGEREPRITRFSVGAGTACAADDSGDAYCWGANDHGQLGDGSTTDSSRPVAVAHSGPPQNPGVIRVAVGSTTSCALLDGGSAMCWGSDEDGRLGRGESD
jgi:serine/threonine-protein kinase